MPRRRREPWRALRLTRWWIDRVHPGAHRTRPEPVRRAGPGQYVFISPPALTRSPRGTHLITESTPLANPHWQYARDKIALRGPVMRAHREEDFPVTIVRPSLTYGETQITLAVNSWERSYTAVDRMRQGARKRLCPAMVCLWVITHTTDFAKGLGGSAGHPQATGHRLPHIDGRSPDLGPVLPHGGGGRRGGGATGSHSVRLHRRLPARQAGRPDLATRPPAWSSTTARSNDSSRISVRPRVSRKVYGARCRGSTPTRAPADRCRCKCPMGQTDRGVRTGCRGRAAALFRG